ncbi:killer cell lectin-like receptor subfamily F member 1 [Clarias gariepinus]
MFTLVKENKTWEEALQYCRRKYTGLAIVDSVTLLDLLQIETEQAQTVSVWTGLRFLSGKWVWVNGTLPKSLVSLPSCPVEPYRCAAYNFNTSVWENRDCDEELNFICYK